MYHNKDFICDAAAELENVAGIPVTVDSSHKEYDTILTINNVQYTVEARSEIREANKGIVLAQLRELKEVSRRPVIIVAGFIAKDIAKEFKEKAINYIDSAGNAYIKQKNFQLFISGQKVHKAKKINQSRAFQKAGIKLIFCLLSNPENLLLSYRELAEKTGIAIGSISNIMIELEDLNFILKTETKRILKNKKELLNRWIVAYHDVLRPRLIKRKMRFSDKSKYRNWKGIILNQTKEIDTLWGGEPGAAILTNFLKPGTYTIYTTKSWHECAIRFGLVPDDKGDIEILLLFWNFVNPKEKDLSIVPPVLIYADLINSGFDRNIETAKIIFDNELQNIK
jgi:hypothetical protein